jgi:hypothetical protein
MKKFLLTLSLIATVSLLLPSPAFAAENGIQKFFSSVTTSISNSVQRLSLLLPGDKNGKIVINQAAQASQNIKSAFVNSEMIFDLQEKETSLANIKLDISGPFEMNTVYDSNAYKQELHALGVVTMQGTTLTADADFKLTKDFIYFKLNQVPAVPVFDFTPIKGKWLKTENGKPASAATTDESTPPLNTDQEQRMKDALTQLLTEAQYSSAKKETKNSRPVYVLDVTLSKEAILDYAKTVIQIQQENAQTDAAKMEADQKQVESSLAKLLDNASELKATLWVDRSSFYITHIDVPIVFTVPAEQKNEDSVAVSALVGGSSPLAALDKVDKVKMTLTTDLKDFNQPIQFSEPTDAQDAKEAFQGLMGSSAPVVPAFGEESSELPGLTPQQKLQLQKYEKMKLEMDAAEQN